MAYIALGVFLLIEGFNKLGATIQYKEILQGVCLIIAGVVFVITNL